ncbi:hypothetical protein N9I89_03340 [Porticoccaceae bacterium]|nr:hypothetical protein [Porticoccaceae bacterium]
MLKTNDLLHKLAFSLVIFLMLGCNSIKQNQKTETLKPEQAINDAKALTRKQGTSVSETSQKPKLVKVSKAAPWLNHPLEASYAGNIDAKTVLLSILSKQPVKFEIEGNGPPVKADPKAKTFKQHLDTICEQANWAYRISDGVVTFSDWQVINYPIHFILGQKNINLTPARMVGNNSDGSSSQTSSQTNSLSISKNSLSELKEIMGKLIVKSKADKSLSKNPSYSIIKSTNSILVSAPPNIQKQIKNALTTINAVAGRTIHLEFDIYSVELFETYEKALDINVLKNTGVKISSIVKPDLLGDGEKPYMFSLISEKSKYNSVVMLKALSESGKASLVNKGTLHLKNNQAGDISATSLISMVEISPTEDFQSTHPEYRESTIRVLPSIIGEKINLHMIISNSDNKPFLKSLKRERVTQSSSTNSNLPEFQIQAEVATIKLGEQFVIPTKVKNGETLIIGGLTRKFITDNQQKNQMLPFFGDGKNKRQRRSETIVVLTAYLSD